ncbi:hypothetical protein [Streptomyces similanensis]|uniref:Uncharacterized protein n=1 Tax=Streptomyces similanensis TaxID=1274988 RepID=A0ABP9L449_9ACTN
MSDTTAAKASCSPCALEPLDLVADSCGPCERDNRRILVLLVANLVVVFVALAAVCAYVVGSTARSHPAPAPATSAAPADPWPAPSSPAATWMPSPSLSAPGPNGTPCNIFDAECNSGSGGAGGVVERGASADGA